MAAAGQHHQAEAGDVDRQRLVVGDLVGHDLAALPEPEQAGLQLALFARALELDLARDRAGGEDAVDDLDRAAVERDGAAAVLDRRRLSS